MKYKAKIGRRDGLIKLLPLALVTSLVLSACGDIVNFKYWREIDLGSQLKPVEGPSYHPVTEVNPLNAVVYIYRPYSEWADQELQAPSIFIQGQRMLGLKNNMYVALELEPGRHHLSAWRPLTVVHVSTIFDLKLDVDPGEIYFMRYSEVDIPPELSFEEGFVSDGPLYQVTEEFARHEIRLTHSSEAKIQEKARTERCEETQELIDEDNDAGGWSTNWKSFVKLGVDC